MKTSLEGRVAVVMGGTRGIGRAIALKLASCGAQVVLQGRDAAAAEEVIEASEGTVKPIFAKAEIDSYVGVDSVFEASIKQFGRVDIAVANGGPRRPGPELFHLVAPNDLATYISTRLNNRMFTIHAAVARMLPNGYGKIITLTSDAGRVPTPSESLIGAAAAAQIFLTRALAKELARHGIRINTIATTLTSGTPGYENYLAERATDPDKVIVRAFKKIESMAPFGINRAESLAELALYLASPESDQMSGATISVNGGISFPDY